MTKKAGGKDVATDLLDAAERLLIRDGYAALSTRKIAREADCNPALVHYYYGSLGELLGAVLERTFGPTHHLLDGARNAPRRRWWEALTRPLRGSGEGGWNIKLWFEISAMALNNPELRELISAARLEHKQQVVNRQGRDPEQAMLIALAKGLAVERLMGMTEDHDAVLDVVDALLFPDEAPPSVSGDPHRRFRWRGKSSTSS